MRIKGIVFISIVCVGLAATFVSAEEAASPAGEEPKEGIVSTREVIDVGNMICPISAHKVGEMGEVVKHEYNGKIYSLCCKMCMIDFNKDPEKYSKIADDEVAAMVAQKAAAEAAAGN